VDFGIAKLALPSTGGQALTALGSVFGTPEYMAPEQARGSNIDHRADLYTLGIVLYEMLAGHTPFAAQDPTEVLIAQITKPPPPLPGFIEPALAAIVMQLLQKDPAKRIASASELAERLRSVLTSGAAGAGPIQAPPPIAPSLPPLARAPLPEPAAQPSAVVPVLERSGFVAPPEQRPSNAPASAGALALVLILVTIFSLALVVALGLLFGWI
jgi:serine/threonine-protein kinase